MTWHPTVGLAFGAAILLLVAGGLFLHLRRRRRVAEAFGDPMLLTRLVGVDLRRVPWSRVLLVIGAAMALAGALADPRWGIGEADSSVRGGPVVLVIDVSSSMLVEDGTPTRLAAARTTAAGLVSELAGVPVGIVVFAGRAYALAPPTRDAGAIDLYLDALDTRMITQTGSALAGAIRQGVGLLLAGGGEGGSLVVISDGNTMEERDDLEEAISLARRARIPIVTVGVGSVEGGPVPDLDPATGERIGYKQDAVGRLVQSQLHEGLLRAIASGTGGEYLPMGEASAERLARLVRGVAGWGAGQEVSGPPRFAWLAVLALLLLALEALLARGLRGRLVRRNLGGGVAALLLALSAGCADPRAPSPEAADQPVDSVAMYRRVAAAQPGESVPLYNLGTVLLQRQRFEEARPPLEAATRAAEPELRQRARYNLGNTRLEPFFTPGGAAPRDREERLRLLRDAIEDYRQALRLDADDVDAKWNLELALRLMRDERTRPPEPEPPDPPEPEGPGAGGGGGGGGGGATGDGGRGGGGAGTQDPLPQAGSGGLDRPSMSRKEAEELLQQAANREVGVQRETLEKPQPRGGIAH
ncbi:MAG TPA: VWA domain-containing protein [Longimicrobiaceae bacterium]